MQTPPLKQQPRDPFLNIVKHLKINVNNIYINTLTPEFSYTNHKGALVFPKKCVLL